MVDQLTLQTIGILFTGVSLTVAAIYYTITIRNQNRTRQAQLLMNLYESYRSTESRRQSLEIQSWDWKSPNEFFEKYRQEVNPDAWALWEAKASFFNGIGILLKKGLIDIELLDELLTSSINRHWNILGMGVILTEWRKRLPERKLEEEWKYDPDYLDQRDSIVITPFHGFDYLYHSLIKYRKTHSQS